MFGGFSVGVDLMLASNAEKVLGILGAELTGVESKASRLKAELGTVKAAFVGAFAVGAAKELLGVMDDMIKKGADLEQQLYRIATAGYTKTDIAEFKKNATKVAGQFRNVNEKELLKLTLETSAVYGDPKTAMKFLPISAAYIAAEKFRHPENPEGAAAIAEDAIFKVLRSEEFRGLAQDPREVKRGLAASLKGQEVFGDQFDPAIGFQFMKYLRLSGRYVSDRFLNGPGLIVAQEMGGSNAGNSHNMVMQALVGGHANKSAIEEMMKVGMIDQNKVDKVGGKNWHYDISRAVPDVKLLQSDFDLWAQQHIKVPVDAFTKGDLSKRDQELRKIFGRATQQQYAELMAWQTGPGGRFAKDVGLLGQALSPEQAVATAGDNLATAGQNLATQVDRIATNVGAVGARMEGHVAKAALPTLSGLADRTGTDERLNQILFGAGVTTALGLGGVIAYQGIKVGSRMWKALNPPKLPDDEGGPSEPGAGGPRAPNGPSGGNDEGGGATRARPSVRPRPTVRDLPPKLRPPGPRLSPAERAAATARAMAPDREATPEERASPSVKARPPSRAGAPLTRINPASPPEPQGARVAASARPPGAGAPRVRLGPQAPLRPPPRPDPLRLRPPGTEHIDLRTTAGAGAGKAVGVVAEGAVERVGAGLMGKVVGRLLLAPVSEMMMGWDTLQGMKRNQETYGAGAWAWLTHNRAMSERAYARMETTGLNVGGRGGPGQPRNLQGPLAATVPEDAKLRAAYGTTIKAVNDLGAASAAAAKDQIAVGKAARDFTSALIAMAQQARTIQLTSITNLDGRQVAKTVTEHQAHAAGGPRGTRRQDTSANLPAVFAPYPGP